METAIVDRHRRIADHIIDGTVITIDHDPVLALAAEVVRDLDVVVSVGAAVLVTRKIDVVSRRAFAPC